MLLGIAITLVKGHEPKSCETLRVTVGRFSTFANVKMKGQNKKTLNINPPKPFAKFNQKPNHYAHSVLKTGLNQSCFLVSGP